LILLEGVTMAATEPGVEHVPWSAMPIDLLQQRAPLDHRWQSSIARLRGWLADPESAEINYGDEPFQTTVIARALDAALRLYANGVAAPTGVVPDCDGAIVFEKHIGDPNPEGTFWERRIVRFTAEETIELLEINSEGKSERRVIPA
jgi:hypothetical protein